MSSEGEALPVTSSFFPKSISWRSVTAARAAESAPVNATAAAIGGFPPEMTGSRARAVRRAIPATSLSTSTLATILWTDPSNTGVAASTRAAASARASRCSVRWLRRPWWGIRSPWVETSHSDTKRVLSPARSFVSIAARWGLLHALQRAP